MFEWHAKHEIARKRNWNGLQIRLTIEPRENILHRMYLTMYGEQAIEEEEGQAIATQYVHVQCDRKTMSANYN